MNTYYQADGWSKFSEEDIYQDGCQPKTAMHYGGNDRFKAKSINALIQTILGFTGGEREDLDLNPCEEIGRLDISIFEDEYGTRATRSQIDAWKAGELRLWSSIYSFKIEKTTTETIDLLEELSA